MKSPLKSRKLWMAIITGILIGLSEAFDLKIPQEVLLTIAGIVVSYILGESYVDAKRADAEKQAEVTKFYIDQDSRRMELQKQGEAKGGTQ